MKSLIVGDIEIKLTKKRARSITTRVRDGEVIVSAPYYVSQKGVIEVIEKQLPWIRKHLEKAGKKKNNSRLKYEDGEGIYFLGSKYELKIKEQKDIKRIKVEIDKIGKRVFVIVPEKDEKEKIKKAIDSKFKKELRAKIDELLPICLEKTGQNIVSYDIRKMTTSWGICHVKDKTITFSLQLAQRSDEEIEYIIIHELTHFIEPNHSMKFKEQMTKFMPNWRKVKKELNS